MKVGTTNGDVTEMTSGVSPGDEIVLTGVDKLQEGSKVNEAKGNFDGALQAYQIAANDQLLSSAGYRPLIIAYRNGAPVKMTDVASVEDDTAALVVAAHRLAKPDERRTAGSGGVDREGLYVLNDSTIARSRLRHRRACRKRQCRGAS